MIWIKDLVARRSDNHGEPIKRSREVPADSVWIVIGIVAAFGALGLALAFVDLTASAKAITYEEEQSRRKR
ncbi:hypothetical protein [Pelagibacterium halotolerans]|uniref:hypothetical protein n=1 Tax=Pelagibacterium halotolerans TaxID=531813 RepID=UPI00384F9E1B